MNYGIKSMSEYNYKFINYLEDLDETIETGHWYLYFTLSSYPNDLIRPLFDKIHKLKEAGNTLGIVIRTYDKNFSDEEIYTFSCLESILSMINIPLYFDGGYKDYYSLKELIKTDKVLDEVIAKIKDANLSPLESFLSVYQYLLKFQYKAEQRSENEEDNHRAVYLSRDIISIMNSDYIVCEGYARIMDYLLSNLGITCFKQTLYVDGGAHMNNLVYLEDDKYQVKGLYYSDSCWDSYNGDLEFCLLPLSDVSNLLTSVDVYAGYLPFYRVRNYRMLGDYRLLDAYLRNDQTFPDLIEKHHLQDYMGETYGKGINLFLNKRKETIDLLIDTFKEMHIEKDLYGGYGTLPYGTSMNFFMAMLLLSKDNIAIVKHQIRQACHFKETGLNVLNDEERPYFKGEAIFNDSIGTADLYEYLNKMKDFPYENYNLSIEAMNERFEQIDEKPIDAELFFSYYTINILQRAYMLVKMEETAEQYPLGEPIPIETFKKALTVALKVENDLSEKEINEKVKQMINTTIMQSKECFYDADNYFYKEQLIDYDLVTDIFVEA